MTKIFSIFITLFLMSCSSVHYVPELPSVRINTLTNFKHQMPINVIYTPSNIWYPDYYTYTFTNNNLPYYNIYTFNNWNTPIYFSTLYRNNLTCSQRSSFIVPSIIRTQNTRTLVRTSQGTIIPRTPQNSLISRPISTQSTRPSQNTRTTRTASTQNTRISRTQTRTFRKND